MNRTSRSFLGANACSLSLALLIMGAVYAPSPANAYTPPPCATTECPGTGPAAFAGVTAAVMAALAVLEQDIYANMLYFKDALVRVANQHSQVRERTVKAMSGSGDSVAVAMTQSQMGVTRAAFAPQYIPSRTACGVESRSQTVVKATRQARAAVGSAESANTAIYTNAPSTPGSRGQISYYTARFNNRMTKYCNNATVAAPSGVPCTASIGVDRDLFPSDSLFKQGSISSTGDYEAAKDVVLNLMGDAVKDPIRGPALLRQEGQGGSVNLYSEQAKLNLASSVLMSMVERRREMSGTSEFGEQQGASYTEQAIQKLAEANAGQGESENMDTVASMLFDTNRSIFVLRDYLEQWAAIKAVSLAIDVKQGASTATPVGAVPRGN